MTAKNLGLFLAILLSCFNISCGKEDPKKPDNQTENPTPPTGSTDGLSYLVGNQSEFTTAMNKAKAGDEIVLKDGTWKNVTLLINVSGTEDKPLVVRAQNDGKAVISGNSKMHIAGDWVHVSGLSFKDGYVADGKSKKTIVHFYYGSKAANHSTLSNCAFDNFSPSNKSYDDTFIGLKGTYNTVEYCYFGNKNNMGLYITVWREVGKEDHHRIYRNFFYRPQTHNKQQNGQEIIRIGTSEDSQSSSYTTVEGNFFYQCNGEMEIISIKSCNNTIKDNTFVDCDGAVTLRHSDNSTISGNYFIAKNSTRMGGVRVIGKGHKIFNNYFYGMKTNSGRSAIAVHMGYTNGPLNSYAYCDNITIAGNTFADCKVTYTIGAKIDIMPEYELKAPQNISIIGCMSVTGLDDADIIQVGDHGDLDQAEFTDCINITNNNANDSYQRTTMTIAGITVPKLVANTTSANLPSELTKDISGALRPSPSPIGAISKAESTPTATVADQNICGPKWSGWINPVK